MWSLGMPCAWHFAAKGQLSCGKPAERRGGARWNRAADGCPHAASEPITLFPCVTFFICRLSPRDSQSHLARRFRVCVCQGVTLSQPFVPYSAFCLNESGPLGEAGMYRILLLDDKSLTWHAVTGQPGATLRRLISGRATSSDWTAAPPLLFLLESG